MASHNVAAPTPLRFICLTRKSKGEDEGTHVDQRRIMEDRCAREGFTIVRVDSEKGISGTKKWREREVGRAVDDCIAGRADGDASARSRSTGFTAATPSPSATAGRSARMARRTSPAT